LPAIPAIAGAKIFDVRGDVEAKPRAWKQKKINWKKSL